MQAKIFGRSRWSYLSVSGGKHKVNKAHYRPAIWQQISNSKHLKPTSQRNTRTHIRPVGRATHERTKQHTKITFLSPVPPRWNQTIREGGKRRTVFFGFFYAMPALRYHLLWHNSDLGRGASYTWVRSKWTRLIEKLVCVLYTGKYVNVEVFTADKKSQSALFTVTTTVRIHST